MEKSKVQNIIEELDKLGFDSMEDETGRKEIVEGYWDNNEDDDELGLYIMNDRYMYDKYLAPATEKVYMGQEDEVDWMRIAIEGARRYRKEIGQSLGLDGAGYKKTGEYLKDLCIDRANDRKRTETKNESLNDYIEFKVYAKSYTDGTEKLIGKNRDFKDTKKAVEFADELIKGGYTDVYIDGIKAEDENKLIPLKYIKDGVVQYDDIDPDFAKKDEDFKSAKMTKADYKEIKAKKFEKAPLKESSNRYLTQADVENGTASDEDYLESFEYIYSNLINGNITDYKKMIKELEDSHELGAYKDYLEEHGLDGKLEKYLEKSKAQNLIDDLEELEESRADKIRKGAYKRVVRESVKTSLNYSNIVDVYGGKDNITITLNTIKEETSLKDLFSIIELGGTPLTEKVANSLRRIVRGRITVKYADGDFSSLSFTPNSSEKNAYNIEANSGSLFTCIIRLYESVSKTCHNHISINEISSDKAENANIKRQVDSVLATGKSNLSNNKDDKEESEKLIAKSTKSNKQIKAWKKAKGIEESKGSVVAKFDNGRHEICKCAEGYYNRYEITEGKARFTTKCVESLPTALGALRKRYPNAEEVTSVNESKTRKR